MKKYVIVSSICFLLSQSLLPATAVYAAEQRTSVATPASDATRTTTDTQRTVTRDTTADRSVTYTPPLREPSAVNPQWSSGGRTSTGEPACADKELPDLAITDVVLTNIANANEAESLDYTFAVHIKNLQSSVHAKSVWLLAYDSSYLAGKSTYVSLGDGNDALAVAKVENTTSSGLSLGCDGTASEYVIETFSVRLPKHTDPKNISFIIDGFDVLLEANEGQKGGVFSAMSNNVFAYSFSHPFGDFELGNIVDTASALQLDTFLLDTTNADNLNALESIGAGLAVIAVENIGAADIDIQATGAIDGTNTVFSQGYPKDTFTFSGLDAVGASVMTKDGGTWTAPGIVMPKGKSPGVVLLLYTAQKQYIPLYIYAYIDATSTASPAPISCKIDDPSCMPDNYFFIDTGWATFDTIPNTSAITGTTHVSAFDICKVGPSNATITKILMVEEVQFPKVYVPSISKDSKKKLVVTLDGESIAEAQTVVDYFGANEYIYDSYEHDMNLPTAKVLEPGTCTHLDVTLSGIQHIGATNYYIKKLVGSVPLYTQGADGLYHNVGATKEWNSNTVENELTEKYIIPETPYVANGTTVLYAPTSTNGLVVATGEETSSYIYINPEFVQPSPEEWKQNDSLLGEYNALGVMTLGNHYNQEQYVSSVHMRVTTDFSSELIQFPLYTEVTDVLPWDIQDRYHTRYPRQEPYGESQLVDIPAYGVTDVYVPIDRLIANGYETSIGFYIKTQLGYEGTVTMEYVEALDADGNPIDVVHSTSINQYEPEFAIYANNWEPLTYTETITYKFSDKFEGGILVYADPVQYNAQKHWFSQYEDEQSILYFNMNIHDYSLEEFESLHFDEPLHIHVKTNHDGPLGLKMAIHENWLQNSATESVVEVENGDVIDIDLNELLNTAVLPYFGSKEFTIRVTGVDVYPASNDVTYLKFDIDPVSVSNVETGETYIAEIYTYTEETKSWGNIPFVNAEHTASTLLGNEVLWQSQNLNKANNFYFVDEIIDNQINMNTTCFLAQGDMRITKLVYTHDTHAQQPFEDVLLSYWGTTIYLPITSWTETESIFELSDPLVMHHDQSTCFTLDVYNPLEELKDMFFDLSSIEAQVQLLSDKVIEDTVIPVILQNGELLSPLNPVKGAKTDFIM